MGGAFLEIVPISRHISSWTEFHETYA